VGSIACVSIVYDAMTASSSAGHMGFGFIGLLILVAGLVSALTAAGVVGCADAAGSCIWSAAEG
jgi:hypothetical protein